MISKVSFLNSLLKFKKPNLSYNNNYKFTLPTSTNGLLNINSKYNKISHNSNNSSNSFRYSFIFKSINNNNNNNNNNNSWSKYNSSSSRISSGINDNKSLLSREFVTGGKANKKNLFNRQFSNRGNMKLGDVVRNDGIGIADLEYESYLKQMERNMSLRLFLKNAYVSTSMGFISSVLSGLFFAQAIGGPSLGVSLIGLLGSIGSIVAFNSQTPSFETVDAIYENKNSRNFESRNIVKITVPRYPVGMVASFIGVAVSNGLIMSPLLAATPAVMIFKALLMGGVVSGLSSYFALRMKPESMQVYRPVLYGSLFSLCGLGLVSIATHYFLGPNVFTETAFSIDLYGGLALFTALNMLDTQEAVKEFQETNKPDFLKCSISLLLNSINIFIRLLTISRRNN